MSGAAGKPGLLRAGLSRPSDAGGGLLDKRRRVATGRLRVSGALRSPRMEGPLRGREPPCAAATSGLGPWGRGWLVDRCRLPEAGGRSGPPSACGAAAREACRANCTRPHHRAVSSGPQGLSGSPRSSQKRGQPGRPALGAQGGLLGLGSEGTYFLSVHQAILCSRL